MRISAENYLTPSTTVMGNIENAIRDSQKIWKSLSVEQKRIISKKPTIRGNMEKEEILFNDAYILCGKKSPLYKKY